MLREIFNSAQIDEYFHCEMLLKFACDEIGDESRQSGMLRMLFIRCHLINNELVTPAKPGLARPVWLYALLALVSQTQRRTFGAMPRTTPKFGVFVLRSLARFFASTKTMTSGDAIGLQSLIWRFPTAILPWGKTNFRVVRASRTCACCIANSRCDYTITRFAG